MDVAGGGRHGGSPGAQHQIRISAAAVTQCCGQSPADQDLGLGCGQQLCLQCVVVAEVPPGLGLTPDFLFLRVPRSVGICDLLGIRSAGKSYCHFRCFLRCRHPSLPADGTATLQQTWRGLWVSGPCTHTVAEMLHKHHPPLSVPRIHPDAAAEQPCRQPRLSEGFGFAPFSPGVDWPRHEATAPRSSALLERIY